MKVYTKTGDKGTTGLLTGERVEKDSVRVEAYGTVDELDAALGVARSFCANTAVKDTLVKMQKLLMLLMAELASADGTVYITAEHVQQLEQAIDQFEGQLPPLKEFLTFGDQTASAALNAARTVARRAERAVWRLARAAVINEQVLITLNRLSDLCFVLSRAEVSL